MLNPPVNGKIQGLFKVFVCYSSTFQGKLKFQGLFKTVLYIQVFFKPVSTLRQCRLWQALSYAALSEALLVLYAISIKIS